MMPQCKDTILMDQKYVSFSLCKIFFHVSGFVQTICACTAHTHTHTHSHFHREALWSDELLHQTTGKNTTPTCNQWRYGSIPTANTLSNTHTVVSYFILQYLLHYFIIKCFSNIDKTCHWKGAYLANVLG